MIDQIGVFCGDKPWMSPTEKSNRSYILAEEWKAEKCTVGNSLIQMSKQNQLKKSGRTRTDIHKTHKCNVRQIFVTNPTTTKR